METTPRIHVELELERVPGPIAGDLTTALGREHFAGWLELTAALERARATGATEVAAR